MSELRQELEDEIKTVDRDFQLRSFSYSPSGNNGIFCAVQDVPGKSGARTLYSGCYLLGLEEGRLYAVVRRENPIYADKDLEKVVGFSGAVWRP